MRMQSPLPLPTPAAAVEPLPPPEATAPVDPPIVPGDSRLRFDPKVSSVYGDILPPGLVEEARDALGAAQTPSERLASESEDDLTFGEWFRRRSSRFGTNILVDNRNFYSLGSLAVLSADLGVAASLANTPADNHLRVAYQTNVTSHGVRTFVHDFKVFGEGTIWIPVYAGTAILGTFIERFPGGAVTQEWGERSFRTCLVGAVPVLSLQYLTGASRPDESSSGSKWEPFKDNNGVSGHAFIGAVPFMTAAKMTDRPLLKSALYIASAMPGISRINDDAHYTSQVLLGWGLAYLSATAVDRTQLSSDVAFFPMPIANGFGMGMELRR